MTHWDNQAKQWALLGAPLKPSDIDIQNTNSWINEKINSSGKPLSVLVLGVTPELINIPWPTNTTLIAIDHSLLMIQSILPKKTPIIKPFALSGNWLQLPISSSSIDLIIGDGCYSSLAMKDYAIMSKEIRRVLKSTGMFIMRFFTRPNKNESIECIHNDILSNKTDNFHAFKLRLAFALHGNLKEGVCLKNIWETWDIHFKKDVQTYMRQLQWNDQVIGTINTYKDNNISYTFPTLHEIRSALCNDFNEEEIFIPDYYLGQHCPSLKLKPIRSADEVVSI